MTIDRPLPRKHLKMSVRVDVAHDRLLGRVARQMGLSKTDIIEVAVRAYAKRHKRDGERRVQHR